uniref:Uncharacterized protein n=1 Tax=Panagrellus redivivus TaxID=6233 RepID=A0A7E4ZYL7_PANRE
MDAPEVDPPPVLPERVIVGAKKADKRRPAGKSNEFMSLETLERARCGEGIGVVRRREDSSEDTLRESGADADSMSWWVSMTEWASSMVEVE